MQVYWSHLSCFDVNCWVRLLLVHVVTYHNEKLQPIQQDQITATIASRGCQGYTRLNLRSQSNKTARAKKNYLVPAKKQSKSSNLSCMDHKHYTQ